MTLSSLKKKYKYYNNISLPYLVTKGILRKVSCFFNKIFIKHVLGVRVESKLVTGLRLSVMSPKKIKLGNGVVLGDDIAITTELDNGYLVLGEGTEICSRVIIDMSGGLIIGKNVHISKDSMIQTHDHGKLPRSVAQPTSLKISNSAWIGSNVLILPSVISIGERSIIGAGSVLTKSTSDREIWAGNPAKRIGFVN